MLAWESFGEGWVTDAVKQLKLDATVRKAPYGQIVDFAEVDFDKDVVFTWNGTTSGVRVPDTAMDPGGPRRPDDLRRDLRRLRAWTSPGTGSMSSPSPGRRCWAARRRTGCSSSRPAPSTGSKATRPPWPMPKIFRMTKGGKLIEGLFEGETINTPSMLAVEDYLFALDWARSIGGLHGLIARADANAAVIDRFVDRRDWIANLAEDPATRSNTSVCLRFTDPRIRDGAAFAKAVAKRLEKEGVALDAGSYRDAPPGLRIWCGATVETADVAALMPWIDWAFAEEIAAQSAAA